MPIPDHLLPTRFPRAEVERTIRRIHVKPGTTVEMVMDPDYWVHANTGVDTGTRSILNIGDKIEVMADDGSFYLELLVASVDSRGYWAQMRLLNWWPSNLPIKKEWLELQGEKERSRRPVPDAEGYRTEFAGAHQWRIVDRAGKIISKGHASEAEVLAELDRIKSEKAAA